MVYCLNAEIVPIKTPTTEHKIKAVPDKINVALNLSKISSNTGRFKANDLPRSPWTKLPSQMKYLWTNPLSKPSCSLRSFTFSGVA